MSVASKAYQMLGKHWETSCWHRQLVSTWRRHQCPNRHTIVITWPHARGVSDILNVVETTATIRAWTNVCPGGPRPGISQLYPDVSPWTEAWSQVAFFLELVQEHSSVVYCVLLQGFSDHTVSPGKEVNPHFGVIFSHRPPTFFR